MPQRQPYVECLCEACIQAHPNPNHYLRLHVSGLIAHSMQVMAAVCLKMGGAMDEEIAFHLCWHPSSVPTYLGECSDGISHIMWKASTGLLQGNYLQPDICLLCRLILFNTYSSGSAFVTFGPLLGMLFSIRLVLLLLVILVLDNP